MKNKKMLGITFFVITILMLSIIVIPTENIKADESSSIYVDPDVYLNTSDLKALKQLVNESTLSDDILLFETLVDEIVKNGYVDADTVKGILIGLGMVNREVYRGRIGGQACCWAWVHFAIRIPIIPLILWLVPILRWTAEGEYIDLKLGFFDTRIEEEHTGVGIGFLGWYRNGYNYENGYPSGKWFDISGICATMFITYL